MEGNCDIRDRSPLVLANDVSLKALEKLIEADLTKMSKLVQCSYSQIEQLVGRLHTGIIQNALQRKGLSLVMDGPSESKSTIAESTDTHGSETNSLVASWGEWPPRWVQFLRIPSGPPSLVLILGKHVGAAVHFVEKTRFCAGAGCQHCRDGTEIEWRAYFPCLLIKPMPMQSQAWILDLPESTFVEYVAADTEWPQVMMLSREGKTAKSKIHVERSSLRLAYPPPIPFNVKFFLCRTWKCRSPLVFDQPDDFHRFISDGELPNDEQEQADTLPFVPRRKQA